jgi:predicted peroxiredoxin
MSDMKNMGVKITLDIEREMVFNINVIDACKEKFGSIDDILNLGDLESTCWLAVQMLNEGADIYNDDHPDKIAHIDEKRLKRYVTGLNGVSDLNNKVREALLKGLPVDAVEQVEELGKNLIAAQRQKQMPNGTTMNRAQRRAKK